MSRVIQTLIGGESQTVIGGESQTLTGGESQTSESSVSNMCSVLPLFIIPLPPNRSISGASLSSPEQGCNLKQIRKYWIQVPVSQVVLLV